MSLNKTALFAVLLNITPGLLFGQRLAGTNPAGAVPSAPPGSNLSVGSLVSVIEIAPNGDSLLIFGRQARDGARALTQPAMREVDPRSTIQIHFNDVPIEGIPPFAVQMRGSVYANSTKRPLEIPRYYEAGVAQATPQARTMLLARGKSLVSSAAREALLLKSRSDAAINAAADDADSRKKLAETGSRLDTLRIVRRSFLDVRERIAAQQNSGDSIQLSKSIRELEARLDSNTQNIALLEKQVEQTQKAATFKDSSDKVKAYKTALATLSMAPVVSAVIKALTAAELSGARREIAALRKVDASILQLQLTQIGTSLLDAHAASLSNDLSLPQLQAIVAAVKENLDVLIQIEESLKVVQGNQDLLLPDATITLSNSSVSEGERVSITIDLISEDGALLESKTLTYSALKLGYVVKNVRDVAFLVNRSLRGQQSRTTVINSIRSAFISPAPVSDRLLYDVLPRSANLPSKELFTPAPGVVLEALIRPRPAATKRGALLKAVRYLGLSVGLSVSFVQFSDEHLDVKVPSFEDIQKLSKSGALADSAFSLQAITFSKNDLGIAPAIHIGIFDGAISVAYGTNLRSERSPRFTAVGFSFIGLTQAGQKLWAQIAGN